jgi:poly-gamma-glutamate capsule biosynthesis protein CapA/YwtB (metallophosphatase superfamily)
MGAEGRFRLVLTGDAIINRTIPWVNDSGFEQVRKLISSANAAFTNLELTCPQAPISPSTTYQGHHVAAPRGVIDELLKLGFNLYSFANNHTTDYGAKGLQDTIAAFKGANAVIAGAGDTLDQARRPRYLETPSGRVGLIAVGVSNAWLSAAADPSGYDVGRPGINPLRFRTEYFLDQKRFEALDEILRALQIPGAPAAPQERPGLLPFPDRNLHILTRPEGSLQFESALIQRGAQPEVRQRILKEDGAAICRWIGEARRQSDWVVVSIHCHEGASGGWDTGEPPQFLIDAAHDFIDAGANVIAGHGPHRLRPIEIYKGRPIFYSLGSFFFINEVFEHYPREIYEHFSLGVEATPGDLVDRRFIGADGKRLGWRDNAGPWESVVAECQFSGDHLDNIQLRPILMGQERPRMRSGYPVIAPAADAVRILNEMAASAKRFGTSLKVEESSGSAIGSIELG